MLHYDRGLALFRKALDHGATRTGATSCRWDMSNGCENPYHRTTHARHAVPHEKYLVAGATKRGSLFIDMMTPCRKCARCRRSRSAIWRNRIKRETSRSVRTWFGTLTLSPEKHVYCLSAARVKASQRSVTWEDLSPEERSRRTLEVALGEVTKFFKRVKTNSGAPLRRIVVTEWHKSGYPHFHVLIHESSLKPVTYRTLDKAWSWGFSQFKLVPADEPHRALYVAKYLTKSFESRVRASERYGRDLKTVEAPAALAVTKCVKPNVRGNDVKVGMTRKGIRENKVDEGAQVPTKSSLAPAVDPISPVHKERAQ